MTTHSMADLEELEYVSYRVWPNENTLKIWNDRELIHYDGQHPVFGDKYEPHEEVVLPDFTGNRPHEFFYEQHRRLKEYSVNVWVKLIDQMSTFQSDNPHFASSQMSTMARGTSSHSTSTLTRTTMVTSAHVNGSKHSSADEHHHVTNVIVYDGEPRSADETAAADALRTLDAELDINGSDPEYATTEILNGQDNGYIESTEETHVQQIPVATDRVSRGAPHIVSTTDDGITVDAEGKVTPTNDQTLIEHHQKFVQHQEHMVLETFSRPPVEGVSTVEIITTRTPSNTAIEGDNYDHTDIPVQQAYPVQPASVPTQLTQPHHVIIANASTTSSGHDYNHDYSQHHTNGTATIQTTVDEQHVNTVTMPTSMTTHHQFTPTVYTSPSDGPVIVSTVDRHEPKPVSMNSSSIAVSLRSDDRNMPHTPANSPIVQCAFVPTDRDGHKSRVEHGNDASNAFSQHRRVSDALHNLSTTTTTTTVTHVYSSDSNLISSNVVVQSDAYNDGIEGSTDKTIVFELQKQQQAYDAELESILPSIPTHYESSGNEIPEWQRRLMARQHLEHLKNTGKIISPPASWELAMPAASQ